LSPCSGCTRSEASTSPAAKVQGAGGGVKDMMGAGGALCAEGRVTKGQSGL
jgi:hypothetical protein